MSGTSVKEQEDDAGSGDEQEVEEVEECSVCSEGMQGKRDEIDTLPCDHRFHRSCIDNWERTCLHKGISPSCPYCQVVTYTSGGSRRSLGDYNCSSDHHRGYILTE